MKNLWDEYQRARSSTLGKSAGWMLVGQGFSLLFQSGYIIILARLLGSFEFGIYIGAVALVSVVSQYSSLGTSYVLLQNVSRDASTFASHWGNVLLTNSLLGTFLVAALAWYGPHWSRSYSHLLVLYVAAADCFCLQLLSATGRIFQAFQRLQVTAGLNMVGNFLRVLTGALLLWRFHQVSAEQWALLSVIILLVATVISVSKVLLEYGPPRFDSNFSRRHLGDGAVFAFSATTSNLYNDFDKAMLGHLGMNVANGIYTMAYRVIDVCMLPILSIHSAAVPRFFMKGVGGPRATSTYGVKILKLTAPLGILLSLAIFLLAPVIPHLLGQSFRDSVQAARWLCLLPFFRSFQLSAGDALTGAGKQKLRLCLQCFSACLNIGMNLCLIPRYGWVGAAWTSLLTDAVLGTVNWLALITITAQAKASTNINTQLGGN